MKTIRIGVASDQEIQNRMLDIAAGRKKPSEQEARIWVRSVDEFRKLLSEKNMNLLAAFALNDQNQSASLLGICRKIRAT